MALVPAECAPCIYHSLRWLGGILAWSETPLGALALVPPGRCRPKSACALLRATHHGLQSSLQMAATFIELGGFWRREN